jgi:hypothetical protein
MTDDRLKLLRRKVKENRRASASTPARDDFLKQQDEWHNKIATGASRVHLVAGNILSILKTFFQRSALSIVAALILLVGVMLACEAYSLSSGIIPGPLLPKPGVPFSEAADNFNLITQTFSALDWFWFGCNCAIAVVVQILQWGSVKFILAWGNVARNGGKLPLKGFSLIVFALFCGALWYQDLTIVSSLYLRDGLSLGGILVWAWSALPSEISESIYQLQKSLPVEG